MIACMHCASLIFASTQFLEKTDDLTNSRNAFYETIRESECNEELCKGMVYLIDRNPTAALSALDLATRHCQHDSPQNETAAIIAFCRAIAYDQLGLRDLSLMAIDSLNDSLREEVASCEEQEAKMIDDESQKSAEFMNRLAELAPSSDIEESLHLIVDQMSGLELDGWLADGEGAASHRHGYSKFVRRWTHILKRVGQLLELIRNIEHIIKNGKNL